MLNVEIIILHPRLQHRELFHANLHLIRIYVERVCSSICSNATDKDKIESQIGSILLRERLLNYLGEGKEKAGKLFQRLGLRLRKWDIMPNE